MACNANQKTYFYIFYHENTPSLQSLVTVVSADLLDVDKLRFFFSRQDEI